MNQNRSWPGTPNRYSTRRSLIVMRPKSIATVVVVLPVTPRRSSRPAPALDRRSSVSSGRTSLIALTSVVFPAPKPPAMRILCAASNWASAASLAPPAPSVPSERAEPIEYLLNHVVARQLDGGPVPHHPHRLLEDQVGEQHADHAYRQCRVGGDVGHRHRPLAQAEDLAVLRGLPDRVVAGVAFPADGDHHGDQVEHLTVGRLGPAAGDRVRADHRSQVAADPLAVPAGRRHLNHSAWVPDAGNLGCDIRCGLARFASIAISYATWPASAFGGQSAARQLPSPAAMTNSRPFSSSMIVCRTPPASKWSPAPVARLCMAAATADRCSASSRSRSRDEAMSRPSRDKMTAFLKSSTRDDRSSSSQARSRPPVASPSAITSPRRAVPCRLAAWHRVPCRRATWRTARWRWRCRSPRCPRPRSLGCRRSPGFAASRSAGTRTGSARARARAPLAAHARARGPPGR